MQKSKLTEDERRNLERVRKLLNERMLADTRQTENVQQAPVQENLKEEYTLKYGLAISVVLAVIAFCLLFFFIGKTPDWFLERLMPRV